MAKSINTYLRGNVVDMTQHHDWLLIAAHHSEGQALGVQALPIRNFEFDASQMVQISSVKPIQQLIALPNKLTEPIPLISIEETAHDLAMLRLCLEHKDILKQHHAASLADLHRQLVKKAQVESHELSPIEASTLEFVQAGYGEKADVFCAELDELIRAHDSTLCFGPGVGPGQKVLALDESGVLFAVPQLAPVGETQAESMVLQAVHYDAVIEYAAAYSPEAVLLVSERAGQQVVEIYDIEAQTILWRTPCPQLPSSEEEGVSLDRRITAIATDPDSGRFALGFDDGLYLFYEPQKSKTEGVEFTQCILYNTQGTPLEVCHEQPIHHLIFSTDHSNVPYLIASAADLSMTIVNLTEKIPRSKGESKGHSANIRQFLKGPTQYFYSIAADDTLRMWETAKNDSSSIYLSAGQMALGLISVEDKRGEWSSVDVLFNAIANPNGNAEEVAIDINPITYKRRHQANIALTVAEEILEGKVDESSIFTLFGVHATGIEFIYSSDPNDRMVFFELVAPWKDELSVELLKVLLDTEEHPPYISKGLELLNATQHPRLPVIFANFMSIDREATCLQTFEYLRLEHIYGAESLYPLELANDSQFLSVRQAALRGYAELARKRTENPQNVLYQSAFEKVLECLSDSEDDIIDVAFEFLFNAEQPLMPGVNGVLTAIATGHRHVQRRGLNLLYTKGMLKAPESKDAAKDLLRQVREINNAELRHQAFILSLVLEEGVQQYLRFIDSDTHTKLRDLEREQHAKALADSHSGLNLDQSIVELFLAAVPEPAKEDKEVDLDEAKEILDQAQISLEYPVHKAQTFLYCIQTFPMRERVKVFMLDELERRTTNPQPLERDLTASEVGLLQEMAVSYQPSIASLGALALAKLGHVAALPILLSLVENADELVRSRAVDGLLSFTDEPIVLEKLHSIIMFASNEALKPYSRDKGVEIRRLVKDNRFTIQRWMVDDIVHLIFEDGVYSQTERMSVRYLFESVKIEFASDNRQYLLQKIREKSYLPREVNIRAKILRTLFRLAEAESKVALYRLIRDSQDSAFEDVRVLGVVRLQEIIDAKIEAEPNWKTTWRMLSAEDWAIDEAGHAPIGGLLTNKDGTLVPEDELIDPLMPVVGLPRPLLEEVQLFNRVFFWRGHESLQEVLKTYFKHDLIGGQFFDTFRFLLALPVKAVFDSLLERTLENIQATEIKGDPSVARWHRELWNDFLKHPNDAYAYRFYEAAREIFRKPKTEEELKQIEDGEEIPPYAPFERAAYESSHRQIQVDALSVMLEYYSDEWVCDYIFRSIASSDRSVRGKAVNWYAKETIKKNDQLYAFVSDLLQSDHKDMFECGMNCLRDNLSKLMTDSTGQILLSRLDAFWHADSFVDEDLVYSEFVDTRTFAALPTSTTSEQGIDAGYYDRLCRIFVYETEDDIAPAKEAHQQQLTDLEAQIAQHKAERSLSEDALSKLDNKDELYLLIQERHQLKAPTPRQNSRFFSILSLLEHAPGGWVDGLLDQAMLSNDEKLSNEAFGVYLARGLSGDDATDFATKMLKDNHPRLDDMFEVLHTRRKNFNIKQLLLHCTQLSRIDLVYRAFDALVRRELFSEDEWRSLMDSPHQYMSFKAIEHFLDSPTLRRQTLEQITRSFCKIPMPQDRLAQINVADMPQKTVPEILQSIEDAPEYDVQRHDLVHLFIKNGRNLNFQAIQILRKEMSLSPSFVQVLRRDDMHCLVSGIELERAVQLQFELAKHDVVLVISQSNVIYHRQTAQLWRNIVRYIVEHIEDAHFESDSELFSDLENILISRQVKRRRLSVQVISAMGSVAGPADCATLITYLSEDGNRQRAAETALVRTGHLQGLQSAFVNERSTRETIAAMLACGPQASDYFKRAIVGEKNSRFLENCVLAWLLQRSQYGGNIDVMMSMLSSLHQPTALHAAQILASFYDQHNFFTDVVSLLKLEKVELRKPLRNQSFHSVEDWQMAMAKVKEAYIGHYQVDTDSEFLPSPDSYLAAQRALKPEPSEQERAAKSSSLVYAIPIADWKILAKGLSANNPRVRYQAATLLYDVHNGQINSTTFKSELERIQSRMDSDALSAVEFEPFMLNGRVLDRSAAAQFSFGALSGILRNSEGMKAEIRRKAFASIIRLAKRHPLPTAPSVLSVVFNDPDTDIREEAFVLALQNTEALGCTRAEVIRQATNSVALRNAQAVSQNKTQFDSLNHLILSEHHIQGEHEHILAMIPNTVHYMAYLGLELLLAYRDKKSRAPSYVIPALQAGLKAVNAHIRNDIVSKIKYELSLANQHNIRDKQPHEAVYAETIDLEPFWQLFIQALGHGVEYIRDEAAGQLIEAKRMEVVPFVYSNWLDSFDSMAQEQACEALEVLKPEDASTRLFDRICNDPAETADIFAISSTLQTLNQYSESFVERLFDLLSKSDVSSERFEACYELLCQFTGYSTDSEDLSQNHVFRNGLLSRLMRFLMHRTLFPQLNELLRSIERHVDQPNAELDDLLKQLALITYREGSTDRLRLKALQLCGRRYMSMTPEISSVPRLEQKAEAQLLSGWEDNDRAALRMALEENLLFHPVKAKLKTEKSGFQFEAAHALMSCQGYTSRAFNTLKWILNNKSDRLNRRLDAIHALSVTQDLQLLSSLMTLAGLDSRGGSLPVANLKKETPIELSQAAISYLGLYHYTERRIDIVRHLLRYLKSNEFRCEALAALFSFLEHEDVYEALADGLVEINPHKPAYWMESSCSIPTLNTSPSTGAAWIDLLLRLYDALGKGEGQIRRQKIISATVLPYMLTVNLNQIYSHYLTLPESKTITQDIEIYLHKYSGFLSIDNKAILIQRIKAQSTENDILHLLRESIRRSNQSGQVIDAFEQALLERRLKAKKDGREVMNTRDLSQALTIVDSGLHLSATDLNELLMCLTDRTRYPITDETRHAFHGKLSGTAFDLPFDLLDSLSPIDWKVDVDMWEDVLSEKIEGGQLYFELLKKEFLEGFDLYESLLDILESKSQSHDEQKIILASIITVRMEWMALQRQVNLGVKGLDRQISAYEDAWQESLRLISAIDYEGEELVYLLSKQKYDIPFKLKAAALELYLERHEADADQKVLFRLYWESPALRNQIVKALHIQHLITFLPESVTQLELMANIIHEFISKLDRVLRSDTVDIAFWMQISQARRGLASDGFAAELRRHMQEEPAELNAFWIKSTRSRAQRSAIIESLLVPDFIQILEKRSPLSSMYLATVYEGRPLLEAVTILRAETAAAKQAAIDAAQSLQGQVDQAAAKRQGESVENTSSSTLTSNTFDEQQILLVLSSAKDPNVRQQLEKWGVLHHNASVHRQHVDAIQNVRRMRFIKEL